MTGAWVAIWAVLTSICSWSVRWRVREWLSGLYSRPYVPDMWGDGCVSGYLGCTHVHMFLICEVTGAWVAIWAVLTSICSWSVRWRVREWLSGLYSRPYAPDLWDDGCVSGYLGCTHVHMLLICEVTGAWVAIWAVLTSICSWSVRWRVREWLSGLYSRPYAPDLWDDGCVSGYLGCPHVHMFLICEVTGAWVAIWAVLTSICSWSVRWRVREWLSGLSSRPYVPDLWGDGCMSGYLGCTHVHMFLICEMTGAWVAIWAVLTSICSWSVRWRVREWLSGLYSRPYVPDLWGDGCVSGYLGCTHVHMFLICEVTGAWVAIWAVLTSICSWSVRWRVREWLSGLYSRPYVPDLWDDGCVSGYLGCPHVHMFLICEVTGAWVAIWAVLTSICSWSVRWRVRKWLSGLSSRPYVPDLWGDGCVSGYLGCTHVHMFLICEVTGAWVAIWAVLTSICSWSVRWRVREWLYGLYSRPYVPDLWGDGCVSGYLGCPHFHMFLICEVTGAWVAIWAVLTSICSWSLRWRVREWLSGLYSRPYVPDLWDDGCVSGYLGCTHVHMFVICEVTGAWVAIWAVLTSICSWSVRWRVREWQSGLYSRPYVPDLWDDGCVSGYLGCPHVHMFLICEVTGAWVAIWAVLTSICSWSVRWRVCEWLSGLYSRPYVRDLWGDGCVSGYLGCTHVHMFLICEVTGAWVAIWAVLTSMCSWSSQCLQEPKAIGELTHG